MPRSKLALIVGALFIVALAASSGRFLVVNQARKSDVIVVVAGETDSCWLRVTHHG
jgi:hypothetical protein